MNTLSFIALVGVVASLVNMVVNYNNDPAFWGWLSSAAWGVVAILNEITSDK